MLAFRICCKVNKKYDTDNNYAQKEEKNTDKKDLPSTYL